MANKKRMKKSTYLIVWSLVFALILGATGIANGVALYWDSALSLYFGEVGGQQSAEARPATASISPAITPILMLVWRVTRTLPTALPPRVLCC